MRCPLPGRSIITVPDYTNIAQCRFLFLKRWPQLYILSFFSLLPAVVRFSLVLACSFLFSKTKTSWQKLDCRLEQNDFLCTSAFMASLSTLAMYAISSSRTHHTLHDHLFNSVLLSRERREEDELPSQSDLFGARLVLPCHISNIYNVNQAQKSHFMDGFTCYRPALFAIFSALLSLVCTPAFS